MKTSTFLTLLGLPLLTLTFLWSQSVPFGPATDGVYLLAATPSGRFNASFGAELYRFDSAGKLVLVREIVDTDPTKNVDTDPTKKERARGVDFVLVDHENRVLIIGSPKVTPKRLDMVLMDSPTAPVSRALQLPDPGAPWEAWATTNRMNTPTGPGAPDSSLVKVKFVDNGVNSLVLRYASNRGV